jgi:MFS family permease
MHDPHPRFTHDFTLILITQFVFFSAAQLLLPTLPLYLAKLGSSKTQIGILMGTMSLACVISRPLVGRALVRAHEKHFMIAGAAVSAACSVAYLVMPLFWALVPVRAAQGSAVGMFHTSTTTYAANSSEPSRRPRALSHLTVAVNLASAISPPIGILIASHLGFGPLFLICAAVSLCACVLSGIVRESSMPAVKTAVSGDRLLLSRTAFRPSIVGFGAFFIWGSLATFYPLYATSMGVANPGLFFTALAIMFIATRTFGGRVFDIQKRRAVLGGCLVLTGAAMCLLWASRTQLMFIVAAVVLGAGLGFFTPTVLAFALDLSGSSSSALAVATVYAFLDTGQFLGPMAMGVVVQHLGYSGMFFCLVLVSLLSILYLWRSTGKGSGGLTPRTA